MKAKGTAWETAVVRYLLAAGIDAHRVPQSGIRDTGDVHVGRLLALEGKDVGTITLAAFVDQANAEAENAGRLVGAAVVKRRRRPVGDAYVVLDLDGLIRLLADHPATPSTR